MNEMDMDNSEIAKTQIKPYDGAKFGFYLD